MSEGLKLAMRRREERIGRLGAELKEVLGASKRITLEIGCGKGHYLSAYGCEFPDEVCVGIDLISSRIRDGHKKNEKKGNGNVFFIKAEAFEFLEALPEDVKINKLFIFFPDPWPKKRHHRRRLIQEPFLTLALQKCSPDAKLWFRTDHEGYFEWATDALKSHSGWKLQASTELPFEEVSQFQRILPVFSTLCAAAAGQK